MRKHAVQFGVGIFLVTFTFFWPQIMGITQEPDKVATNKPVVLSPGAKDKLSDKIVAKNEKVRKIEVAKQEETIRILKQKLATKKVSPIAPRTKRKIRTQQITRYRDTCVSKRIYIHRKTWMQRLFNTKD